MKTIYDIIIVGGGMVGASLARALQNISLRVALIDALPLTADDPRLIALNYSSCCLFKNLGIWENLLPHATPIQQVHVSHKGRFGITRLTAEGLNIPALGYVVPAKYINQALNAEIKTDIFRPATLKTISQSDTHATLTVATDSGEKILEGKIIIGADGSHSTLRELLNIPAETLDYQQSAIVTITELQRPHQHIAYERFQQTGAIAMLPLTDQRCATIWTDSTDNITQLMQLDDAAFLQALQKQFGYRLGRLQKIQKRHVFPLQFIQTKTTHKQHVMLIGNAAHTLHPIAAQGLNLALYEVAVLAEHLQQQPIDLQQLQKSILPQQKISSQLSHRLAWLFSSDLFIIRFARQAGMIGLDIMPSAKNRFIQRAIGRTGWTPSLLLEKGYS